MPGPLDGVRVVDLTWALAGPYCTMILADLGAEVVKVELPGRGDGSRATSPLIKHLSAYFASVNRNKQSITLNLKAPRGKALLRRLIAGADVLVENFRRGTMADLGFDYEAVRAVNRRIVYASISGFGQTGPYTTRPAYDVVAQAMAGTLSITGEPGGPPIRCGFSIGDIGASVFCAIAILAALHEREQLGEGQRIDVAMLDAQVALLENAFARYFATGQVPGPSRTRHPSTAPFQAFPSADGYVVVAVSTEAQWERFVRALGQAAWLADPRFKDRTERTRQHAALEPLISAVTRTRVTVAWLAALEAADVPCGPLNTIAQAAADPQIEARDMFATVERPGVGLVRLVNTPMKFSRTPAAVRAPSPELGQHTAEVLSRLAGVSPEEPEQLRREGVV